LFDFLCNPLLLYLFCLFHVDISWISYPWGYFLISGSGTKEDNNDDNMIIANKDSENNPREGEGVVDKEDEAKEVGQNDYTKYTPSSELVQNPNET